MRYVEIYPDKDSGFVIRFMQDNGKQENDLMHVIYCRAIAHSDLIQAWIKEAKAP